MEPAFDLLGYELATGGRISIVNRLDRETSGILLVAKKAGAARVAGLAMQRGEIRKEYLALVFGWPEWDEKAIEGPIVRSAKSLHRPYGWSAQCIQTERPH